MARAYGEKANQNMLKPIERLSSGLRINSASDDAAGLAVSNKMTANIRDYDMAVRNSVDMISLLATAESALAQINQIQSRLMELAIQSANGVYTQQDRDSMEMELYGLVAEIDRIALNAEFSETKLLDGSFEVSGSSSRDILSC
jgi:flagellin